MRRALRAGLRPHATPALIVALTVALALMAGAYMGVAFADEETGTPSGLEKMETSVGGDGQSQDGQSSQDGEGEEGEAADENAVEPSSEVVTSYYHDAWYEAGHSDGTVPQSEDDDAAETEGSGDASKPDADSEGEEATSEDETEGEEPSLDPQLNNLGEGNAIDLQQVPDTSFLYDTTIYDLVNLGASGGRIQTVAVKGEVVGEPIRAAHGKYWITLDHVDDDEVIDGNKKEASISVLVDGSTLQLIDTYGGYNKKGTILRVRGTFYYACTSHEGIMDIHAESVSVSDRGETSVDEFDINEFMPGIVLCVIALALTAVYQFLAERQK